MPMDKVKVWTRQSDGILDILEREGRYIVKKEYIEKKMEEHAGLYLDVYTWYSAKAGSVSPKPAGVLYPVWVSLSQEEKLDDTEGDVTLELSVERSSLIVLDIDKWGYIVNYMYIPKDKQDEAEHDRMLGDYRIDDTKAYMTPFYPSVKSKIIKSWDRLFDDTIVMSPVKIGTIWEIRKEWILNITR